VKSPEQIIWEYRQRLARHPVQRELLEIRRTVGGGLIVPMNERDKSARAMTANLTRQGIEQMAMRTASTMAQSRFQPARPGDRAKAEARRKLDVMRGWWDDNWMPLMQHQRAMHLWAYAASPVMIRPDFDRAIPSWQVRDPLCCFPAERSNRLNPVPDDCIFALKHPWTWIHSKYNGTCNLGPLIDPVADKFLNHPHHHPSNAVSSHEVLEYVDAEQITLIALGPDRPDGGTAHVVLDWQPNLTGRPLAVVPELISIDEPRSPYADMPGMHYNAAYLDALNLTAVEDGIFPQVYFVQRPGEVLEVELAHPRQGFPGKIKGGDIRTVEVNPGYKTDTMSSKLERNQRLEAGIPAEFGGEASSTVRTARRGDQILSAAVDFRIQKAQQIFEASLYAEDCCAIAVDKAFWGNEAKSYYMGSGKAKGAADSYVPLKLWDSDRHTVRYSMAGADLNSIVVVVGQLVGIGLLSQETAREVISLIEDGELEHDRTTAESLHRATLAMLQQQASDPNGPYQPADWAYLNKLIVEENIPLYTAIERLDKRVTERQEAEAAAAAEGAGPPMPGLATPGAPGAPGQIPPTVAAPSEGQGNLAQLLNQMRTARSMERVA